MWTGPREPYQTLPPLPPQNVQNTRVLKATIRASRSLAALDVACRRLPDPTLLINMLPLLEAQASSEIENIVTTSDELFRAAHDLDIQRASPDVKEALRYRTALRAGYEHLENGTLSSETAIVVGSALLDEPAIVRDRDGVYIGNPRTRSPLYTPPTGQDLLATKLAEWQNFLHNPAEIDPLVATALQHYQFEAIHPFFDANGRTGRVLNLLCLKHFDLLQLPVLYLSSYFLRTRRDYYSNLMAVTEAGAWEQWVEYFLYGVEQMSRHTLDLIDRVLLSQQELKQTLASVDKKLPAAELAEVLSQQPYARIKDIVDAGLAERQTASRWLTALAKAGVLNDEKVGRNKLFINHKLLHVLTSAGDDL